MRMFLVCAFALCLTSCAKTVPVTLTPAAAVAQQKTQVIRALDLLRDIAIDAHAQTPPLISTADTRTIVLCHTSVLQLLDGLSDGWQRSVSDSLTALLNRLPSDVVTRLTPYVVLIRSLLEAS